VTKEPGLNDFVAIVEKQRKGIKLTEDEQRSIAAVEKKRKEAQNSSNNSSTGVV
jgi:hypothetical protein